MARARKANGADADPVEGQTEVREIAETPEYTWHDGVSRIVGELIRDTGSFRGLTQLSMEHLIRGGHYRGGNRPAKLDGGIVQAYTISKREHDRHGFDAGVWIRQHHWDNFTAEQRRAALFHALCHFEVTDSGALRTRPHTVEAFDLEVRLFGLWLPEHEVIQTNLDLFRERGGEMVPKKAVVDESGRVVPFTKGAGQPAAGA